MKYLVILFVVFVAWLRLRTNKPIDVSAEDSWPIELLERTSQERLQLEKLRSEYPKLFASISAAMFKHDSIGINFETNCDEYDAEVGTVMPRLKDCRSSDEVVTVLFDEFVNWFGKDSAGPREHYVALGTEIWELWQKGEPT